MPQEAVMKVAIVCFYFIMYNKTSVSCTQVMWGESLFSLDLPWNWQLSVCWLSEWVDKWVDVLVFCCVSDRSNLREKGLILAQSPMGRVHYNAEGMAQKHEASWSSCLGRQETGSRVSLQNLKALPQWFVSSWESQLPIDPITSPKASPGSNRMMKYMSWWGALHIQTTTAMFL